MIYNSCQNLFLTLYKVDYIFQNLYSSKTTFLSGNDVKNFEDIEDLRGLSTHKKTRLNRLKRM